MSNEPTGRTALDRDQRRARNEPVIEAFRQDGGPANVLLLHTVGRRSGQEHLCPLSFLVIDRGWAIFAANAGQRENPDWYLNVAAHPQTTIEVGTAAHTVLAREVEGGERADYLDRQMRVNAYFAESVSLATAAGRVIPVIVLEPIA